MPDTIPSVSTNIDSFLYSQTFYVGLANMILILQIKLST